VAYWQQHQQLMPQSVQYEADVQRAGLMCIYQCVKSNRIHNGDISSEIQLVEVILTILNHNNDEIIRLLALEILTELVSKGNYMLLNDIQIFKTLIKALHNGRINNPDRLREATYNAI